MSALQELGDSCGLLPRALTFRCRSDSSDSKECAKAKVKRLVIAIAILRQYIKQLKIDSMYCSYS